jgi:FAD/FMN-containing dehydrogenase
MRSPTHTNIPRQHNEEDVQVLAQQLRGELIRPDDARYQEARKVWNGMIDRYPALIARCAGVDEVIAAVTFAREHDLALAVRGGGHNVAGHGSCDGGLVVDLAPMKQIEVDPISRVAYVGGGATWGQLDAATQVYGLATPGGVFSGTGIGGLTLGGGFGWLRNKFGLSCDNLIAAEVVTASGQVLRASEAQNADLLWGLRGGGGNFGIVTSFEFRLHQVGPDVMFVFVFHDGSGEQMRQAIQFYRDYSASAPDEVSTLLVCGAISPDSHVFPAALHGRPCVIFAGLYAGPIEAGRRALQPLRDFGEPLLDASGVMPYVAAQQMVDHSFPAGQRYYWKSLNLKGLDDAAIDRIVAHVRAQPSPLCSTDIWHVGGAIRRVSAEESAFHGREAAFLINPEAHWHNPADDDANLAWARGLIADLEEFSDGSRYLNFSGFQEEGEAMMRAAFGPQYGRLAALKAKYDPTNLFRLNQNIKPAHTA